MSRLATSFVLGYHGCDARVAEAAIAGEIALLKSERNYDWLGSGVYFWESDPTRALEWAEWKARRGDFAEPAVIGAAIDLRNCLDLVSREDLELLKSAYDSFEAQQAAAGLVLPENRNAADDPNGDRLLRFLDCAVIRHLHTIVDRSRADIEPFDTVRGIFTEGGHLYPGSGFQKRTHVQIAVRTLSCIKGIFRPPV